MPGEGWLAAVSPEGSELEMDDGCSAAWSAGLDLPQPPSSKRGRQSASWDIPHAFQNLLINTGALARCNAGLPHQSRFNGFRRLLTNSERVRGSPVGGCTLHGSSTTAGARLSNAHFPLTPTLSLGERGRPCAVFCDGEGFASSRD